MRLSHQKVEELLGPVSWVSSIGGNCQCPGEHLHTSPTRASDCKVTIMAEQADGRVLPPGVYCFHDSCKDECKRVSRELRKMVGGQVLNKMATTRQPSRAHLNPLEMIRRFVARSTEISCEEVQGKSLLPIPAEPLKQTLLTLKQMYAPVDFVNVEFGSDDGRVICGGETRIASSWIESWEQSPPTWKPGGAWIRLNPTDRMGIADENIKKHKYCLLECDDIPIGWQLSLFAQLPLPIALITLSGGKSAHAWVAVEAADLEEYQEQTGRIFKSLEPFGIDQKTKNASRLGRLPGAVRKIGARGDGMQRLLYINPDATAKPIL